MAYKTILAAVSGGAASSGAAELACRLGKRFAAHVEGFHVKTDVQALLASTVGVVGMPIDGAWIDRIVAEADRLAATTKASFEAVAARYGLGPGGRDENPQGSLGWRESTGDGPALITREARLYDLVVLGRSDRVFDQPHTDAIEQVLLHSGRPVLLAPAKTPEAFGDNIVVGWNDSPEAARALTASLPLLTAASRVTVLTIDDHSLGRAAGPIDYLGWHGIHAQHKHWSSMHGADPGEQLLTAARNEGADLLVMGAFGHAPWRESIFGGATHGIVGTSLLPVLMMH